MASAEAKARRKENEARSPDAGSQSGQSDMPTSRSSRGSRRGGTRQLDFFQAMSDFHSMFPTLEDDVIEAVLRANDGAVDATIDQLLTMTIDMDVTEEKEGLSEAAMVPLEAFCPKYDERDSKPSVPSVTPVKIEDSPPSYTEAMRSGTSTDTAQSIWTTPIGQPKLALDNSMDRDIDSFHRALSNTEPRGAMAQLSPQRLPSIVGYTPPETGLSANSHRRTSSGDQSVQNTRPKREFKNWNPPMLGNLPDDFLRLIPPDVDSTTGVNSAKNDMERLSNLSTTPVNVLSMLDVKPKIHKNRSKSDKMSKSFSGSPKSAGKEKESKSKSSDKKSKSAEKLSRSLSLTAENGTPDSKGHKASRSQSSRTKDKSSRRRDLNNSNSPHSMILETHDFSKDMLDERMKENERRRQRTSAEYDPEMTQYLQDERMAIALQNSEFLQELRGNEDFMKTLEKERMNLALSAFEPATVRSPPAPSPTLPVETSTRPPDDVHEGYGDDSDKTLDAFPFSRDVGKTRDDDAELRKQLHGMGRASKKQLSALARKFFSRRKKKSSKQILDGKLAPSMMNLLEDEEEEEDDDGHIDSRYGSSPPDIEPLPSSLIGVPSHRTVQRPPYSPEGVTTYFDNKHMDMV